MIVLGRGIGKFQECTAARVEAELETGARVADYFGSWNGGKRLGRAAERPEPYHGSDIRG
jgi:hypothetical protein